ncbi:hypothetical protein [Nocardia sp. NPDC050710]
MAIMGRSGSGKATLLHILAESTASASSRKCPSWLWIS